MRAQVRARDVNMNASIATCVRLVRMEAWVVHVDVRMNKCVRAVCTATYDGSMGLIVHELGEHG